MINFIYKIKENKERKKKENEKKEKQILELSRSTKYILNPREVESNNPTWNLIMNKNPDIIFRSTTRKVPFCVVEDKEIYFIYESFINPDEDDLFDLLHEIGHIRTNTYRMDRCKEEFLATQWAINHCKEYGLNLSDSTIKRYQDYIYRCKTEDKSKIKRKNLLLIVT